jgi:hypothetical protein
MAHAVGEGIRDLEPDKVRRHTIGFLAGDGQNPVERSLALAEDAPEDDRRVKSDARARREPPE